MAEIPKGRTARFAAAGMFLLAAACSESVDRKEISKQDFGDKWPFTVDHGLLRCIPPGQVVFEVAGTAYAVNRVRQPVKHFPPADSILRAKPHGSSNKMSLAPIIGLGLDLCKEP